MSEKKRIYFLVYDDLRSLLFVAIGGKKDQKATIDHIINCFDEYRELLEDMMRDP